MDMRSEIKKLARIEDGQYPFSSLYLNTKWDEEQHIADAFSIDFSEEKSKVILHALERLLDKEREEVVSQIRR